MPSLVYNIGSYQLQHRDVDFLNDTIELIFMKSTYTPNKDDTNSVIAAGEISGVSGYVGGFGGAGRKVLASKTMTNDTANDRTVYDAADPSQYTLGAGDTIGGVMVAKKGSASDATAIPLFFIDITDTPTNGGTFDFAFAAAGIAYTQQ
jgi:hypothetical protein